MIIKSDFESNIAQKYIFKIEDFTNTEKLDKELNENHFHIMTKANENDFDIINFLLKRDFLYSATTIHFENKIENPLDNMDITCFRNLNSNDLDDLFKISDESFSKNNRFANDLFLSSFAIKIHRKWIENSLNGYADYCCGIINNSKMAAFATLHINKHCSTIGLLATAKELRNMGIASKMIDHLKSYSLAKGITKIKIATESINFTAINLYLKKGFKIYNSELSLYRLAR